MSAVLIAMFAFSVGFVLGAAWRSLRAVDRELESFEAGYLEGRKSVGY